jgi:hypothetical protein
MFKDLFIKYPNRNAELRSLAKQMHEFGRTVAQSQSASLNTGLDEHGLKRQLAYVEHAEKMIDAFNQSPVPDMPAVHPLELPIDFTQEYVTFVKDLNGNMVPLNESTQLLAESWMFLAVGLARSQSAALAGSILEFDFERAKNNLGVIRKLLNELKDRPTLDLPETALPGANLTESGYSS